MARKAYRESRDIRYVCRRYPVSKALLMRWNKRFQELNTKGTKEMPYKLQYITYCSSLLLHITPIRVFAMQLKSYPVRLCQIPADHNEDHPTDIVEAKQCCLKHITNQEQEAANGSHCILHESVPACEANLHAMQEHPDAENNKGNHSRHATTYGKFKDLVVRIYICLSRKFLHSGIDTNRRNAEEETSGINKHGFERSDPQIRTTRQSFIKEYTTSRINSK